MSGATMTMNMSTMGSSLHQTVDRLVELSSQPFNIVDSRHQFHEKVRRELDVLDHDQSATDAHNPILVKEELSTQKDYFRKLKMMHLQQEARKNFLLSITEAEPPEVNIAEIDALAQSNAVKKEALKVTKLQVEEMTDRAVQLAQANASRHDTVMRQLAEAQALQKKIRDAELELARIKATHPPNDRVTVAQAGQILDDQTEEIQRLTEETGTTAQQIERVRSEMTHTAKEVQRLSRDRDREEARAREVQEGREAGDTKVDEMCRWLTSSISLYKGLMGIKAVSAVTDNVLRLEYDVASSAGLAVLAVLQLTFDPSTKHLLNAELEGRDPSDIEEARDLAVNRNDAPGLIADLLSRLRSGLL